MISTSILFQYCTLISKGETNLYEYGNEYNDKKQLVKQTIKKNKLEESTTTFAYHAYGKIKSELIDYPDGIVFREIEYNENGDITLWSNKNANLTTSSISYIYNSENKLISSKQM